MAHLVNSRNSLELAAHTKQTILADGDQAWSYAGQFSDGNAVADYVNTSPAQGAGEIAVTGNSGGSFDVWIYI